jgi:hypothetical protein
MHLFDQENKFHWQHFEEFVLLYPKNVGCCRYLKNSNRFLTDNKLRLEEVQEKIRSLISNSFP